MYIVVYCAFGRFIIMLKVTGLRIKVTKVPYSFVVGMCLKAPQSSLSELLSMVIDCKHLVSLFSKLPALKSLSQCSVPCRDP